MIVLKKNLSALIRLVIVFVAFFSISIHFTVSASAKTNNYTYWVIVGTSSDGQSVDAQTIGAVLNWGGTSYIVCDDITEETIYAFSCDGGDIYYQMEGCGNPASVKDGLNWFTPSENLECAPAPVTQGSLGEEYFVYYFNSNLDIETGSITIDECEEYGNMYQVTESTSYIGKGFYPMLIKDESGRLIGYIPSADAALLFEKPTGDSSSSSGGTGTSSGSNESSSNDDSYMTAIIIAAVVILALVGTSYFKKQKSGRSSSASVSEPIVTSKPTQISEQTPIPVPQSPKPLQSPVSVPSPIPALAPTPVPQSVNDQSKEWFIQMDGGVMNGFIYPVHTGVLIGRNPECNVQYPKDTKGISRKHCKIFINNNNLFVMDLGSTSGTFLQGVGQLTPNVPQNIQSGDIIYLGEKKNSIVVRYNR